MTVSSSTSSVTYAGNGVSTVFPFSFPVPGSSPTDQSNLLVVLADTTLTPPTLTVLPTTAWSVTGVSTPTAPSAGGAVTYPVSGAPLAAGRYLTIQRNVAQVQGISIPNQGAFFSAVVEGGLDYLTMLVQQLQAQVSRSLQVAVADPGGVPATLPLAATRANMGLAFDASGNPIAGALPSVAVSTTMTPVFQAGSIPAARALLGVAGGLDTIAVATPSNNSSVDFTGGITSAYDFYELRFSLLAATNLANLNLRTGPGVFKNGATDYRFERSIQAGGVVTPAVNAGTTQFVLHTSVSNTRSIQGRIRFARMGVAGELKYFRWECDHFDGTNMNLTSGSGLYQTDSGALDRVQLFFSAGNVASGVAVLSGLRTT